MGLQISFPSIAIPVGGSFSVGIDVPERDRSRLSRARIGAHAIVEIGDRKAARN
jgi:hypothetical protein